MFSISAVAGLLTDLQVEPDVIEQVVTMLERSASDIAGQPVAEVGDPFGGSALAGSLGHHTSLARRKLAEAMDSMVLNLRGVSDNVRLYERNMTDTDATIAERGLVLTQGIECVAQDGFDKPDACVPAGGDS